MESIMAIATEARNRKLAVICTYTAKTVEISG